MKICIFSHTLNPRTGAGEFTSNLVDGVRKLDPKVSFSILTSEDYLKPKLSKFLLNLPLIREEIRKTDVIHALDAYPYGVMAVISNLFINKPVIITAVGSGSIKFLKNHGWRTKMLKWTYSKAVKITAISSFISRELKKELPPIEAEIINHGVNSNWGTKGITSIDKELNKYKPYILTVGEMKERKGYLQSLSIVKDVFKLVPEAYYIIVSNPNRNSEYWNKVRVKIKEMGITEKVKVLSGLTTEELRGVYHKAGVYLLLPQNINGDVEGFGLSVIEAAAAGVPSIIGQGSGADDAVREGASGYLMDQRNTSEISGRIVKILTNKDVRKKLSQGALKFAEDMRWKNQIQKYKNLYEKI